MNVFYTGTRTKKEDSLIEEHCSARTCM